MAMSRLGVIAGAAAMSFLFSGTASAVTSEGECINKAGTVMDLQSVKHCLVPVIPEEYQGEEYAGEILGVNECVGTLRKTSIGDYCLIALEAKPAPVAVTTPSDSAQINEAIGDAATSEAKAKVEADVEAEAPKKRRGFFGNRN